MKECLYGSLKCKTFCTIITRESLCLNVMFGGFLDATLMCTFFHKHYFFVAKLKYYGLGKNLQKCSLGVLSDSEFERMKSITV